MKWTVGKRITLGFASVIIIAAALGAFAYARLVAISAHANRIAAQSNPIVQLCDELEFVMKTGVLRVYQHIGSENKEDMTRLDEQIAAVSARNTKIYEQLEKMMPAGKGRELLDQTQPSRAEYRKIREEVLGISRQATNNVQAYRLARTKLDPVADKYLSDIEALISYSRAEATVATTGIQSEVQKSLLGIVLGLSLAILVGIAVAFAIIRSTGGLLRQIAGSLNVTAKEIVSAAGQVASGSQSLAEGASQQAASLEETSSSLEEMSSITRRNAESSRKANDLAKQARSGAEKGALDVDAMTAAMSGLKSSSDDIAKIIKTIDEIAFQTNILALNAAVEAARAGEAGMGFAVVAEEVRNLAQRCAQAARETSAKIEGTITKTAQGVDISQKVATTLSEIVSRAREVDELVAEVAGASGEQSQGIDQINTAISQMDKVTQNTAASAEEGAAAAEELTAQTDAMHAAVAELLALVDGGSPVQSNRIAPPAAKFDSSHQPPAPSQTKVRGKVQHVSNRVSRPQKAVPEVPITASVSHGEIPMDDDFRSF